ncbi:MAG: serine/threonine protein kinase [Rubrivivax sp.]|nr:serine/threonine protein kinase [Rubrivivax sp.]
MTLGKRIGRYPVIREIGQGAVGTVYEGFDPATGSKVAIKVLRAEHLPDHRADSAASRFEREAQATRRLQHPNIVAVHEYGEQGRIKFIAMEYLHGRELRTLMRERGRFALDDAVTVTLQILDALGHSHRHGVVHRDIKPSNVMVLEGLQIKVMDFGIARIESAAFTQMGTLLGTPAYMSPEQLRGLPADGRADLWAAGVMLSEMLVGRNPFAGATALEVTRNALTVEPPPVSALVPGLPPSLDAVLARSLAKDRDLRFHEAADFAAELVRAVAAAADAVDLELAADAGPAAVDLDLAAPPAGAAAAAATLPLPARGE